MLYCALSLSFLAAFVGANFDFNAVTCFGEEECHEEWNYEELGDDWPEEHDLCGGDTQSPIDIVTEDISESYSITDSFNAVTVTSDVSLFEVYNNAHTAVMTPVDQFGNQLFGRDAIAKMNGGIVPDGVDFCFHSWHMHWGTEEDPGSEHLLDGKRFPMEAHFIFYDCSMGNISRAIDESLAATEVSEGYKLAVIGVFFEVGEEDNEELAGVIDALEHVYDPLCEVQFSELDIAAIMVDTSMDEYSHREVDEDEDLPIRLDINNFYSYLGSLTTPGCYPIVRWHVAKQYNTLSSAQLDELNSLLDCHDAPITGNYRVPMDNVNDLYGYCTLYDNETPDHPCTVENYLGLDPADDGTEVPDASYQSLISFSSVLLSLFCLMNAV